jgi:hypothetical protein
MAAGALRIDPRELDQVAERIAAEEARAPDDLGRLGDLEPLVLEASSNLVEVLQLDAKVMRGPHGRRSDHQMQLEIGLAQSELDEPRWIEML